MVSVKIKELFNLPTDNMLTFTLANNELRGAVFDGRALVLQMQAQHNLGILETLCLGHACLCVAMFIPMMKGYERVIFRYKTDGKIPGFSVEASSEGWVRGFLFDNKIEVKTPLETWDLKDFFGKGFLTVTRFKKNARTPISGTIAIKHKNIAQDLTEYFLKSEQTQTAITSSIKFDKNGGVKRATALFIQAMPESSDEVLERASYDFISIGSIAKFWEKSNDLKDCVLSAFGALNPEILISRNVQFNCPCSKELFLSKMKLLPQSEIDALCKQETTEVICNNCSSIYHYKASDFYS